MKIRVTLNVTDDARRCIAANMKEKNLPYLSTQDGTATRATVIKFLETVLKTAGDSYAPPDFASPLEREETARGRWVSYHARKGARSGWARSLAR